MLFLFDNNGIDYWINNNINDCCKPHITHNTHQNVELHFEVKATVSKPNLHIKNKNIITEPNTRYNNLNNEFKLKYLHKLSTKQSKEFPNNLAYNKNNNLLNNKTTFHRSNFAEEKVKTISSKTQSKHNNTQYICIESYEQPKLINL
jgi:hypothetical protein